MRSCRWTEAGRCDALRAPTVPVCAERLRQLEMAAAMALPAKCR